jgi:PII-like signaling protein
MWPRSGSSSEKTTSTIAYPLYEAIVLKAREMHLAGATVLRGAMAYGHSTRLHTTKILRFAEDFSLVVEIVDTPGEHQ